MYYIDPHVHMISRVTDDYERMARMGCVGISEPAFWAGFDRGSAASFRDYFRQLTEFEPTRAAAVGIQHYTWLCINAKEAENIPLSREVISVIPEFLDKPNVLGIGEIGDSPRGELKLARERAWRDRGLIHLLDLHVGAHLLPELLQHLPNRAAAPEGPETLPRALTKAASIALFS